MDILTRNAQSAIFGPVLPTESQADELRAVTRQRGIDSLYFFTTAVLGWSKLQSNPHLPLCNFIQSRDARRKVVLIPRDCYKSTIGSKSFPLWILIQPEFFGLPGREHRILLCSFAAENASKQVKSLRQQVERNQFLQWLYPEIVPDFSRTTWTDKNLLFPRDGMYGEDTIEAAGVDTHIVSRHYTVQIKDDLEDKQSAEQPTVRERVKTFYRSAEALFVDEQDAFDLLIGTRWGVDDLYSDIYQNESETYKIYCRPLHWTRDELALDLREAQEDRRPPTFNMDPDVYAPEANKTYYFFPRLFPEDSCRRIKQKQGSWMYSMLYLNNPKDPSLAEFPMNRVQDFEFDDEGNLSLHNADGTHETVIFDSLRRVQIWDPALGEKDIKKNSRNALVVMYGDSKGRLFIAEGYAERKDPTLLFTRFIGFHQRHHLHRSAIEDAGFQRVLKFPLYHKMREMGISFPVHDQKPIGEKDARIRSLIPYAETYSLYIRRGLSDVREEMRQFPVFLTKDLLDAAAACVELLGTAQASGRRVGATAANSRAEVARLATRTSVTGY